MVLLVLMIMLFVAAVVISDYVVRVNAVAASSSDVGVLSLMLILLCC